MSALAYTIPKGLATQRIETLNARIRTKAKSLFRITLYLLRTY